MEKTNNQLTTIGQRILIHSGYKDQDKTCFVYLVLWNLEIIADFYRRACEFIISQKKSKLTLNKALVEIILETTTLVKTLHTLSGSSEVDSFIDMFEKKAKLGDQMEEVFRNGTYEDIVLGHYMTDIQTYIQDCAVAYLGICFGKEEKN